MDWLLAWLPDEVKYQKRDCYKNVRKVTWRNEVERTIKNTSTLKKYEVRYEAHWIADIGLEHTVFSYYKKNEAGVLSSSPPPPSRSLGGGGGGCNTNRCGETEGREGGKKSNNGRPYTSYQPRQKLPDGWY
jgi:hypothetical protein